MLQCMCKTHSLVQGSPIAFLPIIHHALMNYSLPLTQWLDEEGYEMFGKNDLRFIESLYKVTKFLIVIHFMYLFDNTGA